MARCARSPARSADHSSKQLDPLCDPYEIVRTLRSNSYPPAKIFRRPTSTCEGNINVKLVEPPSCSSPSAIVFIGRNRRGQWVAQQQNGLYGGLFVSRAQAVKYALFENGHHPETIVELAREIELDMHDSRSPAGGREPQITRPDQLTAQ